MYKECFIQFLIDNKIYDIFIKYCDSNVNKNDPTLCVDFNDLILNFDSYQYILNAFNWANTIEHWDFWDKYDDDWTNNKENYLKKYKSDKRDKLIKSLYDKN